jgi:sulfofructose kinase
MKIPVQLPPRDARRFDVVGFGVNSFDLIAAVSAYPGPDAKGEIHQLEGRPGGQIATAMVGCARLGCRASYVGRFGTDGYADEGIESLRRATVDTSSVERVHGATSHFSLVIVDESRSARTVLWHRSPGLWWRPDDVPRATIQEGRLLHVDCFEREAAMRAAEHARAAGMATSIDVEQVGPSIELLLDQMDIIIAAETFPSAMTGIDDVPKALADLARRFPRAGVVCVTRGEKGSLARCGGVEIQSPGFVVDCVDSTGAGDVFRAGFIARWLQRGEAAELEDVLEYANAAAALNCRALGARGAIPSMRDVDDLLHSKSRA